MSKLLISDPLSIPSSFALVNHFRFVRRVLSLFEDLRTANECPNSAAFLDPPSELILSGVGPRLLFTIALRDGQASRLWGDSEGDGQG